LIEDIKTIVLLGLMAIASAYIRYKGFFQATVDALLAFWFGYGVYLALDYAALSGATRSGISCIVILFSRPLYDWINEFIRLHLSRLIEQHIGSGKNDGKGI
jgi:hypothetical protein